MHGGVYMMTTRIRTPVQIIIELKLFFLGIYLSRAYENHMILIQIEGLKYCPRVRKRK